jgi:hypothetical protein
LRGDRERRRAAEIELGAIPELDSTIHQNVARGRAGNLRLVLLATFWAGPQVNILDHFGRYSYADIKAAALPAPRRASRMIYPVP